MQSMIERNATDEEKQMVLDLMNEYQLIIKKKRFREPEEKGDER